jgi:GTP pyrophosphokinase
VEWARVSDGNAAQSATYPVKLTIYCDDRAGMLREMTATISEDGTNIRGVDTKAGPGSEAIVEFVVDTSDVRHLLRLMNGLRRVPGVRDVQRQPKL